jgi:hypothetical protein
MHAAISQGPVNQAVSQGGISRQGTEIQNINKSVSGVFASDNASAAMNATPREGFNRKPSAVFSKADDASQNLAATDR